MSFNYYTWCKINTDLTIELIETMLNHCKSLNFLYFDGKSGQIHSIDDILNQELPKKLLEKNPQAISFSFEVNDTLVGFTVKKINDECIVSIGGDLINKKKQFYRHISKNTVEILDILLTITSSFILTDLELYSDYQLFDNFPAKALPGLNAWILVGRKNDSFIEASMLSDQLFYKGFELFETPFSTEPFKDETQCIEDAINNIKPIKLYIKNFQAPEGNKTLPIASLEIDTGIFTIKPLEPYITKKYKNKTGLDLAFYARILLALGYPFGLEEIKYISNVEKQS